jgi:hypothetical protein
VKYLSSDEGPEEEEKLEFEEKDELWSFACLPAHEFLLLASVLCNLVDC